MKFLNLILLLLVTACSNSAQVEKVKFETFKPSTKLDRIMLMLDLEAPGISKDYFSKPQDFKIKVAYVDLDNKEPLEIFIHIENAKYCNKEDCLIALISPPKSLGNKDWTLMIATKGHGVYLSNNYTKDKKDFYILNNTPYNHWFWGLAEDTYEYIPDSIPGKTQLKTGTK